ncbi:sulfite exporter TauE/SafE family protein [Mesoplasma lactucae]|uniref:Probable membrane transporter protein n=1 Tax=Mesoplasma lactucae ATCC 49193 TaxID=81460 RepID=A0A291IQZ8_9MOLU|nr:sulfite exporter TauE/SafE family protein [Mesoplasma lactucae]ATG97219.1 hypothetical protein CP520_00365 [Mesoplasma lactucae ATCC 49193]ATZ20339.1 hypothetical protein MLACT_v1c05180 [Mesoplasma lactucae ATCC 49193]MCL8216510.1 hypothetical protein [Mesoplasma lactucae ATCC 49193]
MKDKKSAKQDLTTDASKTALQTSSTDLVTLKAPNDKMKHLKSFLLVGTLIAALTTTLIGLIVSLLYYVPGTSEPKWEKYNIADHVGPFVIAMIFVGVIIAFTIALVLTAKKHLILDTKTGLASAGSIGFIASFTDVISVGSYGVTMGLNKPLKMNLKPKLMPGTLTVGYAVPQMLESTLFLVAFDVEIVTLITMMAICIVGGIVGSFIAKYVNSQVFRLIAGVMLFVFAILMILVHPQVGVIKAAADGIGTSGLRGWRLAVGLIAYFFLGICSSLGLGIFAPSLAILALLGLSQTAILAIMSASASGMMPPAAIKYMKDKNYNLKDALMMTFGGVFGTLAAFLIIFVGIQVGGDVEMKTFYNVLKWIAVAVIFYCSFMMLFDFGKDFKKYGWNDDTDDVIPDMK